MNSSALPSFPKKPRQYFSPPVLQRSPIKEKQTFKSLPFFASEAKLTVEAAVRKCETFKIVLICF